MVRALRSGWPQDKPLVVRLPAEDLLAGGLTTEDMIFVAQQLGANGVDMVDLSSGGLVPEAGRLSEPLHNARYGPLFRTAGVPVAASGAVCTSTHLAEAVPGLVDAVLVGRALLRDPYWALRDRGTTFWPRQYHRAF
jgi:2,4-dienoyl-CoA reductase-like NADH-dependent reductase (Old Yellow Enzyme family)